MRPLINAGLFVALLVGGGLVTGVTSAWSFTAEERRYLAGQRALLEISPDPCRLASRLEAEYKGLLRKAHPEQDIADILAVADAKPGVPLILADGVRLTGAFALYDDETHTVYLANTEVAPRLMKPGGDCPTDARIAALARDTAGVYVHELSHSLELKALGSGFVTTSEGEILAYARESRFLVGLEGWPAKSVSDELDRRRLLDEQVRRNQKIISLVNGLRGKSPDDGGFKKLEAYVGQLDEIKKNIAHLESQEVKADPLQLSLVEMVDEWKAGWPAFLHMMIRQTSSRPSLGRREENRVAAKHFLEDSRAGLKKEAPGTLGYKIAERAIMLGKKDILFWSDQQKIDQAVSFYTRRFKTVRPAPKTRSN